MPQQYSAGRTWSRTCTMRSTVAIGEPDLTAKRARYRWRKCRIN